MAIVTSLEDWKAKKALERLMEEAEVGPPCPKCDCHMLPGADSNEQVWVCIPCTTIVWTQKYPDLP